MFEEDGRLAAFEREQEALYRKRILLVEDDVRSRSVISQVLAKLGAFVYPAGDGVEAVELLQKQLRKREPVEYAIVDLILPRMNGVALLRYIRDHQNFHALPVIVASGNTDERDLHECRCLGIDDFIPKPVPLRRLVASLVRAVNTRNEKLIVEKDLLEPGPSDFSPLGYPDEFGGFPMPRTYPLRAAYYRCPFCDTTFTAPRLCNRALKPDNNDRLAIGLYTAGLEKDFVEYPLVDVIVCPECLYASDRAGFYRIWTRGEGDRSAVAAIPLQKWEPVYFQVVPRIRSYMSDGMLKRQEIVSRAGDEGQALFTLSSGDETLPRQPVDALVAFDLAALCSQALAGAYRGEPQARLRHKLAGYKLKAFYVVRLLAGPRPDPETVSILRQKRLRLMFEAMQALLTVNDIDFNVLDERLYCLTRRFFLADMLVPHMQNRDEALRLVKVRKRCFTDMRQLLVRARQAKSSETKTIERFLFPLDNRMYEIQKKEEAYRARQQALQQQR